MTGETLREIYGNRFYLVYGVLFFVVWGVGTVVSDVLALNSAWTVMVGIVAATVLDKLAKWLHEWRRARQEVNASAV